MDIGLADPETIEFRDGNRIEGVSAKVAYARLGSISNAKSAPHIGPWI